MKTLHLLTVLALTTFSNSVQSQNQTQKTWVYTYIKAKENQQENLRKFIETNWFAMDSIAVKRRLFNDYQLLENSSEADSLVWDFIVAVEYFTTGTYADIKTEWQDIRKNHKKVLIKGYDFTDLGQVVQSEKLVKYTYEAETKNCTGEQYDMLKPFIGEWHEYLVSKDKEELYGKLKISIDPNECVLTKQFTLLTNPFTYQTLGYYNKDKNAWIETYTFSNGGYSIYQWNRENDDFLLERIKSSSQTDYLNRNRWANVTDSSFQIIEERSYDEGKNWEVNSITNMKKINK